MTDPTTVVITGASGGFARTFLAQLARLPHIRPSVLVDLDLDALASLLDSLGWDRASWTACADSAAIETAVSSGRTAVTTDFALCEPNTYDVLVEATGSTRAGFAFARRAIDQGRHVIMVSKEVESLVGVHLAQLAKEAAVGYVPGLGDQPANLLALLSWVQRVGLDVVAVGKSSEYDLFYDPATQIVRQLDHEVSAPQLSDLLILGDDLSPTLDGRDEATRDFKRAAAADYCEMSVVAQYSGFVPDIDTMHYPIARPNELADIYALSEHGGLLQREGAVDVFSMLRLPGEASFAGGEFVIVRTHDETTWEMLRDKGHVVSRDGRYACIFSPYHLMGIETPLSVLDVVAGRGPMQEPRQYATMVGRAEQSIEVGTALRVAGHHHEIDGVAPRLTGTPPDGAAPFYLLDGATVRRPIKAGATIGVDDIDGYAPELWEAFRAGRALSTSSAQGAIE